MQSLNEVHSREMACFYARDFMSQLQCKFTTFSRIMQAFCQLFLLNLKVFFVPHFEVKFAEIFASQGQLMMLQIGQNLLQLEEEPFAGLIAVGKHMKFQP